MIEEMLIACILALFGSVFSNIGLWYKVGRLELAVFNGRKRRKK